MKGVFFFMRTEQKRRGKRESVSKAGWQTVTAGIAAALVISVLLVGIGAVMISTGIVPERVGDGCVLLACAVGSLLGAGVAARGRGKDKLIVSIGVAMMAAVALGVSGILLYGGIDLGRCIAECAACLCGGGLAGVIGGGRRAKRGYK